MASVISTPRVPRKANSGRTSWIIGTAIISWAAAALVWTFKDRGTELPAPEPVALATPLPGSGRAGADGGWPDASDRLSRIHSALELFPITPEARFRFAIGEAGRDPEVAVVSYARAALLDHERAAYYLGQIFEAGEGVAVDRALAAAWYRHAGSAHGGASRLLAALSPAEAGVPNTPIPLFGARQQDGSVELVWISAEGPDPSGYRVEFATAPGGTMVYARATMISALHDTPPPEARIWRVVALGAEAGQDQAASPWQPILGD